MLYCYFCYLIWFSQLYAQSHLILLTALEKITSQSSLLSGICVCVCVASFPLSFFKIDNTFSLIPLQTRSTTWNILLMISACPASVCLHWVLQDRDFFSNAWECLAVRPWKLLCAGGEARRGCCTVGGQGGGSSAFLSIPEASKKWEGVRPLGQHPRLTYKLPL